MLRHWVLVRAVTSSFHLVAKSVHLVLVGGETEVCWNVLIIVIVDDVVLILADDIHCRKNIERVIHSALNILEVNLLSNLQLKSAKGKHLWSSDILRIGYQKV